MAFRRVVLQPMIRVSAAMTQETRFAVRTTGWKSGQAFINVTENGSTAATTLDLRGATGLNFSDTMGAGTFWPSLGTVSIGIAGTGQFRITPSPIQDYMRWHIGSFTGNPMSFEVVLFLYDA